MEYYTQSLAWNTMQGAYRILYAEPSMEYYWKTITIMDYRNSIERELRKFHNYAPQIET